MYQSILSRLGEHDQAILREAVEGWLTQFGEGLLEPLAERMGSQEFREQFKQAMRERSATKPGTGK